MIVKSENHFGSTIKTFIFYPIEPNKGWRCIPLDVTILKTGTNGFRENKNFC